MKICRFPMAMGVGAVVACLPLLGTSGAILSPMAGTVAVNGQPAAAGSAVVAGDLVSTSAAGSARMVLPDGSVIAASNTIFRMVNVANADQLRLDSGLVKVTGLLPVALDTRTVVPATAATRFNVYDLSGKIYVEDLAGTVAVKAGNTSYTVHAGEAVSFSDPQATQAVGSPIPASVAAAPATFTRGFAYAAIAAAAAATGIIVYEAAKCPHCIASPSS